MLSICLSILHDPFSSKPYSILLICPSVDKSFTNPAIKAWERKDPLQTISKELETSRTWAAGWGLEDPRISPLLSGELGVLKDRQVRVHGVTAGHDILSPDALLLREKLSELGVRGKWLEWERQMHCFPLAFSYRLKESVQGMQWMVDVLRREESEWHWFY